MFHFIMQVKLLEDPSLGILEMDLKRKDSLSCLHMKISYVNVKSEEHYELVIRSRKILGVRVNVGQLFDQKSTVGQNLDFSCINFVVYFGIL